LVDAMKIIVIVFMKDMHLFVVKMVETIKIHVKQTAIILKLNIWDYVDLVQVIHAKVSVKILKIHIITLDIIDQQFKDMHSQIDINNYHNSLVNLKNNFPI